MANYTITLSEETYHRLLSAAQAQGITPEHWIDAQLAGQTDELQPLSQRLTGLIGAIDSKATPVSLLPLSYGQRPLATWYIQNIASICIPVPTDRA